MSWRKRKRIVHLRRDIDFARARALDHSFPVLWGIYPDGYPAVSTTNPETLNYLLIEEFRRMKVTEIAKPKPILPKDRFQKFRRLSHAVGRIVLYKTDFFNEGVEEQVRLRTHESHHIRWQQAMGPRRWIFLWLLFVRWRFAFEVSAKRDELRVRKLMGEKNLENNLKTIAERFVQTERLERIHNVHNTCIRLFREALEAPIPGSRL